MIIGPNGTGKSTFVCAVCLGLAGHPTLLGRQKQLAHFIKNGEESAVLEITLKNKPGKDNIVIRREIYQNSKSDWFINRQPSNEQKVKALLSTLNIQLDNLCQFLPQEKVADFAKLTQEQLLEETQRAIDLNLLNQHKSLISLEKITDELNASIFEKKTEETTLLEEQERYKDEAAKYEKFQEKVKDLEIHQKLLPYAEIKQLKDKAEHFRVIRDGLVQDLESLKSMISPFEKASNSFDDKINHYVNLITEVESEISKQNSKLETLTKQLDRIEQNHQHLNEKIQKYINSQNRTKEKITLYKERLEGFHNEKDRLAEFDEAKYKELRVKRSSLADQIQEISSKEDDNKTQIERNKHKQQVIKMRIDALNKESSSKDRLYVLDQVPDYLKRSAHSIKQAINLLRSNDSSFTEFKGKVFEPPCMTITTTKPEYAAILEDVIDNQTIFALTAVSKDVYSKVSKELFDERKINVSFRYINPNSNTAARISREDLQKFGFDGFIKDFLDGPKEVIQMLCEQSFIYDIPVATKPLSDKQIEYLTTLKPDGSLRFRKFYSADIQYNLSVSKYGSRQVIIRTTNVNMNSRYFSSGGISEEHKQRIANKKLELSRELQQYIDRYNELKSEREEILASLDPVNNENIYITSQLRSLSALQKQHSKINEMILSTEQKIKDAEIELSKDYQEDINKNRKRLFVNATEKIKVVNKFSGVYRELLSLKKKITLLEIKKFEETNKRTNVNSLIKNFAQEKRDLESQVSQANEKYREFKNSDRKKELMKIIKAYPEENRDVIRELAQKYDEEDKFSLEEIQNMISKIEAEIKLLGTSSRSSVNTLEKIEERLSKIQNELPILELELKTKEEEKKNIQIAWEPKLNDLVDKISQKFSEIFPSVGSAGEIRIAKAHKFSDWRMEVLVKFRDSAELKALDSHTQSGGERAVSTVFYMISMQELTASPFRVVDEINQGMDARNERIVHKHMVETADQENTSQYFLITPKLLTDLFYSKKMRVHCIMAGPHVPNPVKNPDSLLLGTTSLYV